VSPLRSALWSGTSSDDTERERRDPMKLHGPPKPPTCHYHADRKVRGELVDSAVVYGGRSFGPIWMCPEPGCGAYVGIHANSATFAPKGTLANAETREARKRAHAAFDGLWKGGLMPRTEAYALLAAFMGVEPKRCHIGYMNPAECAQVLAFVKAWRAERTCHEESRFHE
jgi:hypothetical protein